MRIIRKYRVPIVLFTIQILLALPYIIEVNLYYYSVFNQTRNVLTSILIPGALILGFPLFVAGIAFPNSVFASMSSPLDMYPYRPYDQNVIIVFYFIWIMIVCFIIERIIVVLRRKRS